MIASHVNKWNPDDISMAFTGLSVFSVQTPAELSMTVKSNGKIYDGDGGHFRLVLHVEDVVGMSDCIRIGDGLLNVQYLVGNTTFQNNNTNLVNSSMSLAQVLSVKAQKLQHGISSVNWLYTYKFSFTQTKFGSHYFGSSVYTNKGLKASLNSTGCALPRTVGHWYDPRRWSLGAAPTSTDHVYFSKSVGVTVLPPTNTSVASLTMLDGLLLAHNTTCPTGWSPNPNCMTSSKCYKLFDDEVLSFDEAEHSCQTSGLGSMDAHLVQISDLEEQGLVRRMCRGPLGSNPYVGGCWIGLRDQHGTGKYDWIEPKTVRNNTFRDWRRGEWNNHTFSEGESTNGELCVVHVPWQTDPLIVEQGSWNDVACKLKKSYVCQMFASTRKGALSVSGPSILRGGGIEGGYLTLNGNVTLTTFLARRGASVLLHDKSRSKYNILESMLLEDGSSLVISANVTSQTQRAYLGEINISGRSTMLSTVTLSKGVKWTLEKTAVVNAQTEIAGTVLLSGVNSFVEFQQGGLLSAATFMLNTANSQIVLSGSSKLSTYDAFEVKLFQRGIVIGEYGNTTSVELSGAKLKGIYRLRVGSQISNCIPYHASAEDLAMELNKLPIVVDRGGVTVRRYGDGNDPYFTFGYTYRIEMDAPPTSSFDQGPLNFALACQGVVKTCGCAETKVALTDSTGMTSCPRRPDGNSSRIDANACVIPPIIFASRLSSLSYMHSSGIGSLVIRDGTHRLPPKSGIMISSALGGTGLVGADKITWGGIAVDNLGSIVVTGPGWLAWDSATSLWSPEWTDYRGRVAELEKAPSFNMYVKSFYVAGLGRVVTASPHSNMTWSSGYWNGGTIGGRSQLIITKSLIAAGANKALRYGITMKISPAARFTWLTGNLSLANGAQIIVNGNMTVHSDNPKVKQVMGMANLIDSSVPSAYHLLQIEPSYNWHGYYDLSIASNPTLRELQGGFYSNPLCGESCERTPAVYVTDGLFTVDPGANVSFSLPVRLLGRTQKKIGSSSYVEMASGGVCGNNVVVLIFNGTNYVFSGGEMEMRRTCTVAGEGELLITGGRHSMGSEINSHITISGGALVWPKTNPAGDTISFNGGLLISNKGLLEVEPFSTKILVQKEVVFQDQCTLQFPMIGTAAQSSTSDSLDAPDTSPRGSLTALGIMRWNGGTLRGKADFIAQNILYVGGGLKQIRSLAKLINKGHAEWDTGDIVMEDGGDFLNLGSIQMAKDVGSFASSDFYQGTVTPLDNGGDYFSKTFHSYDLDQGALSYKEYVTLRTKFVSQAPPGWSATQQSAALQTPASLT
jgi:hypothetical protein